MARSIPAGRLLAEVLADGLPAAAADRVRRQLAPARRLHVVAPDAATPPEIPEGATNDMTAGTVHPDSTGCDLDDGDAPGGTT